MENQNIEYKENWRNGRKDGFVDGLHLEFDVDDIEYIIVNQKNNIVSFVKKLRKLKKICGKDVKEDDLNVLISKVISFEQIKRDF